MRESNAGIPVTKITSLSAGDFDLLTALHGFMLQTDVTVVATGAGQLTIKFISFRAFAKDRYDWDPTKYFPIPNPDFGNPKKVANPVLPSQKVVVVHHKHAIAVQNAGLAQAYDLQSNPWTVTDFAIMGDAQIDPAKNLN